MIVGRAPIAALFLLGGVACRAEAPAAALPEQRVSAAEYDAAPRAPLTPLTALCAPETTPCELGPQSSAAEGLHGETLVWEYSGVIRRYDATGTQRANLGGTGEGEGEYKLAVAAGPMPGGLGVFDVARLKLITYDSSGRFSHASQVPVPQATRQVVVANGRLVMFTVQSQATGGGSVFRALAASGAGAPDTLAWLALPDYVSRSGRMQELPGLFEAQPVWNAGPIGEVLFSDGASYTVTGFHEGKPMRRLVVEREPRTVDSAETAREADAMRGRVAPALKDAVENAIARVASHQPSITQVVGLGDGGLLVREAPERSGAVVRWTVFSPEWKPTSYVETSPDARLMTIDGRRVLLLERAADGVSLRWYALP